MQEDIYLPPIIHLSSGGGYLMFSGNIRAIDLLWLGAKRAYARSV